MLKYGIILQTPKLLYKNFIYIYIYIYILTSMRISGKKITFDDKGSTRVIFVKNKKLFDIYMTYMLIKH